MSIDCKYHSTVVYCSIHRTGYNIVSYVEATTSSKTDEEVEVGEEEKEKFINKLITISISMNFKWISCIIIGHQKHS